MSEIENVVRNMSDAGLKGAWDLLDAIERQDERDFGMAAQSNVLRAHEHLREEMGFRGIWRPAT